VKAATAELLGSSPPGESHHEGDAYAVVHVVVQEMHKSIVETQVLDHMEIQATAPGALAPANVSVLLLEPLRHAARPGTLARRRRLARRAPHVRVSLGPYVGRLGVGRNASLLARLVRRLGRGHPVVLHCRSEEAVLWALAIRSHMRGGAVVADMRGIWPEEFLHARGYDSVEAAAADEGAMQGYRYALSRMREALEGSDAILAVSEALVSWVDEHIPQRPPATVVPCCVSSVDGDAGARDRVRAELGLTGKTVLCYVGSAERYQHLEDGFARFCSIAVALHGPDRMHVLCLTPAVDRVSGILVGAGVPTTALTVMQVPQSRVGGYLLAADAGFLLRDGSPVNRVSVPVKLGEYLAAGVPVVTSSLLEWTRDLLEGSSGSIAIDWFGIPDDARVRQVEHVLALLTHDHAALRAEALSLARRRFTWRAHVDGVRETYRAALRAHSIVSAAPLAQSR